MHFVFLPFFRQERIHADQWQRAIVLLALVVQALFLNLAALVHRIHRTEHAAALRDALELLVDRFFNQVGQFVDDERALPRVLAEIQTQLAEIISWIATARRTDCSVGVVIASSNALVCRLLQLSNSAYSACSVVRMSLKLISCACRLRPDVCTWYFSICDARWRRSARASHAPRYGAPRGRSPCTRDPCRSRRRNSGSARSRRYPCRAPGSTRRS